MKWIISIFMVLAIAMGILTLFGNLVRRLDMQNITSKPGNGKAALIVYHAGLSNFPNDIVYAITQGLHDEGWQVQIETAYEGTTTPEAFDLLVVVAPTYWWMPAMPITSYLRRLPDIAGQKCMAVITAMGHGQRSLTKLVKQIEDKGGEVVAAHYYYTMAPNDEDNYTVAGNRQIGIDMAKADTRVIAKQEE